MAAHASLHAFINTSINRRNRRFKSTSDDKSKNETWNCYLVNFGEQYVGSVGVSGCVVCFFDVSVCFLAGCSEGKVCCVSLVPTHRSALLQEL